MEDSSLLKDSIQSWQNITYRRVLLAMQSQGQTGFMGMKKKLPFLTRRVTHISQPSLAHHILQLVSGGTRIFPLWDST